MGIPEQSEENADLEYYVSGVGILIVSVVGVSGNIVSGVILRKRQRDTTQTFSDLLIWLSVTDTAFLILVFLIFSLPHFSPHYSSWVFPYIAPVALPCSAIAMTGSVYTVVGLSVERYLTLSSHTQANKGAFLGYFLPVLIFSTFLNSPKFLEFSTKFLKTDNGIYPYIAQTSFRLDPSYTFVLWLNIVFLGLLPFSLLLIFNIFILRLIKESTLLNHSRSQHTASLLLITLVTVQICSHIPRTVLNIYEVYQAHHINTAMPSLLLVDLSHLLLVISSSINVFILTVQDQVFRNDLLSVMFLSPRRDRQGMGDVMDTLVVKNAEDNDSENDITNQNIIQRIELQINVLNDVQ